MSFPIDNRERHIIPRWRDSGTTAALGELDSLGVSAQQSLFDQALFDEKVQEWTENHGISFAGDLLATAISVGSSHPEVMEAADYILASDHASEIARTVARRVLGESFDSPEYPRARASCFPVGASDAPRPHSGVQATTAC